MVSGRSGTARSMHGELGRMGRLVLPTTVEDYVMEKVAEGFTMLPIYWPHAAAVERLPLHHRDPFDRLLAAQALAEKLPLVSSDPVFRSYGWTEPAATFGYFQKYREVAQLTPLRPLVRRPTGGGIVPHDRDWTYSLAVPPGYGWYDLVAVESYRQMHEWIRAAFARLGVETRLAPHAVKSAAGQCFAGYEQLDLLWQGRKLAGAAQRRTRTGLLIQGSVQPPSAGLRREEWESATRAVASALWGVEWVGFAPDDRVRERAACLARFAKTAASG